MLLAKFVFLLLPLLSAHHTAVPPELQSIADQARALPPEFAADVLLKLIASPLATDPKWKRGVIEDAFLSAGGAQAPYKKRGNRLVAPGDVLSNRLEKLTLQTRAVEAMLPLDSRRALTMYQDIATPVLPKLSCQDPLTPDLSAYYETAVHLFTKAFTPVQRKNGDDVHFLRQRVAGITSPSQVVPALKLLDLVELTPETRADLTAAFVAALDQIHGGDREFGEWEPLLVSAAVPEMHETPAVLPALRSYIVRHLSGPRCSDQIKGHLPESAAGFNKLISQVDPTGTRLHAITADEVAPIKDDGTYPAPTMGQSPRAKQALATIAAMGHEDYSTGDQWTSRYVDVLNLLESWKPEDEASLEDYSFLRAAAYSGLIDAQPASSHRSALTSALHFLEQQYDILENRTLWFQEYRIMFDVYHLIDPKPDQAWLLDQLLHSRIPVIVTYAELQKLLGPY